MTAAEGDKILAISVAPEVWDDLHRRAEGEGVTVSGYLLRSVALHRPVEDRRGGARSRRWDWAQWTCAASAIVLCESLVVAGLIVLLFALAPNGVAAVRSG